MSVFFPILRFERQFCWCLHLTFGKYFFRCFFFNFNEREEKKWHKVYTVSHLCWFYCFSSVLCVLLCNDDYLFFLHCIALVVHVACGLEVSSQWMEKNCVINHSIRMIVIDAIVDAGEIPLSAILFEKKMYGICHCHC